MEELLHEPLCPLQELPALKDRFHDRGQSSSRADIAELRESRGNAWKSQDFRQFARQCNSRPAVTAAHIWVSLAAAI
jgi:hypothetical protein